MVEISVIIPVYNIANYIGRTIESVLNQSFTDFEIIIVNDGSTDNSYEICSFYQKKDKRIKLINSLHKGVSQARNQGLDEAKGRFIAFIDGDDFVHPSYLQELYYMISISSSDLAIVNYQETWSNTISLTDEEINIERKLIELSLDRLQNEMFDKMILMVVWGKLYRHSTIMYERFNDFKAGEDFEFNTRIYPLLRKTVFMNSVLYFWCKRDNSLTFTPFNSSRVDDTNTLYTVYNFYKNQNKDLLAGKALLKTYKRMLSSRFHSEDDLKERVREMNSAIYKETRSCFYHQRYIKTKEKIIIGLFWYLPFLYSQFRFWQLNKVLRLRH